MMLDSIPSLLTVHSPGFITGSELKKSRARARISLKIRIAILYEYKVAPSAIRMPRTRRSSCRGPHHHRRRLFQSAVANDIGAGINRITRAENDGAVTFASRRELLGPRHYANRIQMRNPSGRASKTMSSGGPARIAVGRHRILSVGARRALGALTRSPSFRNVRRISCARVRRIIRLKLACETYQTLRCARPTPTPEIYRYRVALHVGKRQAVPVREIDGQCACGMIATFGLGHSI